MMLTTRTSRFSAPTRSDARSLVRAAGQKHLEPLEARQLMALIGSDLLELPIGFYNSTGQTSYEASSGRFDVTATPVTIFFPDGPRDIIANDGDFQIHARIGANGTIIRGAQAGDTALIGQVNANGDDFVIRGGIDLDNSGSIDPLTEQGVLLTGELAQFGYVNNDGPTDNFDYRFVVTGGILAPFFAGRDAGVIQTAEQSTMVGEMEADFTAEAKGFIGPVPAPAPSSISGHVYCDLPTMNGTYDPTDTGLVTTVRLTGTDEAGRAVDLTTTSDSNGAYIFDGLRPGTYTLTETQPAGTQDGPDAAGTFGGTVGNDVISGIVIPGGSDGVGYDFGEVCTPPISSISGFVYYDLNNDGTFQGTESPIPGTTVALTGTDDLGNPVSLSTTTDATGYYFFGNLRPGTYQLNETQPAPYLDGIDTIGTPGGSTSNDQFSNILLPAGFDGVQNNFGEVLASSISGYVYYDRNNDGTFQNTESPIPGTTVALTGTDDLGNFVSLSTTTDATGYYFFGNLRAGTYQLDETQPAPFLDGKDTIGTPGGSTSNDRFSNIMLPFAFDGVQNNFGEVLAFIDLEKYVNSVAAQGGEGLTPGYWKQSHHFDDWFTYTQNQNYNAVFGLSAAQEDASLTLLGALGRGGGGNQALGRHAVAALLNAAHPNVEYAYSTAAIIALVQNAYGAADFEGPKNLLAGENERGADLSSGGSGGGPVLPGFGADADTGPGPTFTVGNTAVFTFVVTNPGIIPLANVVVVDDNQTPGNTADDYSPTPTLAGSFNVGDMNQNMILETGETWLYTSTVIVVAGQHTNIATVYGTPVNNQGQPLGGPITDTDPANYNANPQAPQPGNIRGTKWLDVTGNGLTNDDTGLGGVTVYIDANGNNAKDSGELSTTTAADGTYAFTGLAAGTYVVREIVPANYVRTFPTLADEYTVSVGAGQTINGIDFANAEQCDKSTISSYEFLINGTTVVSDLRGNTNQGDEVTVIFTVASFVTTPHQFTLVSYTAPGPTFVAADAYLQNIYDLATGFFTAGTYTLTVIIPDCNYQIDFVCGAPIDTFGPAGSNIFYSAQTRLFSADNDGCNACVMNESAISGNVYIDKDNDGTFDNNEVGLQGVSVKLTGTDIYGQAVSITKATYSDGSYVFGNLKPGTYTVTETQPGAFTDGKDTAGTLGGTVTNDKIASIVLPANAESMNNNFGERAASGSTLGAGSTATIGFWQNKNGQNLIKSLNGSSNAKNLGNWLASNFPNLFGSAAGTANNLSGKTNTQVASAFKSKFAISGMKIDAQVMAVALAVYATDTDLAGGTYAAAYGFSVSSSGTGAKTFSVGSAGSAIGVSNNSVMSIFDILKKASNVASGGTLFASNSSNRSLLNNLFDAINQSGDIL
ncbi:MAG: SdrD B-like domain-containing protein [Phycisphaerales bacterium]